LRVAAGAGNDYQKDLQFRKLNAQKDVIEVKVFRGGQQTVGTGWPVGAGSSSGICRQPRSSGGMLILPVFVA
jgi:hypothetical protein